jgi:formylglycine-generating enzyme required for sulfatase activity
MGSIVGDDDEKPLRPVIVSAFLLDKYEVSFGQYMRCVEAGRCGAPRYVVPKPVGKVRDQGSPHIKRMPGQDRAQPESARQTVQVKIGSQLVDADLPVAGVTWFDAREYCSFVGKHLPTEAQWEFAARGSKGRYYAWGGDAPDCSRANSERCGRKPMPTSSLP